MQKPLDQEITFTIKTDDYQIRYLKSNIVEVEENGTLIQLSPKDNWKPSYEAV